LKKKTFKPLNQKRFGIDEEFGGLVADVLLCTVVKTAPVVAVPRASTHLEKKGSAA
jgi:hypothetical protein